MGIGLSFKAMNVITAENESLTKSLFLARLRIMTQEFSRSSAYQLRVWASQTYVLQIAHTLLLFRHLIYPLFSLKTSLAQEGLGRIFIFAVLHGIRISPVAFCFGLFPLQKIKMSHHQWRFVH